MKQKEFYYHNANDSYEPRVFVYESEDEAPDYCTGPFDTLELAKQDAIDTTLSMIDTWKHALKHARAIKEVS